MGENQVAELEVNEFPEAPLDVETALALDESDSIQSTLG